MEREEQECSQNKNATFENNNDSQRSLKIFSAAAGSYMELFNLKNTNS